MFKFTFFRVVVEGEARSVEGAISVLSISGEPTVDKAWCKHS